MPFKPGASGNPKGGRKDKPFFDALRLALNREDLTDPERRKKLNVIADKLADLAIAGEPWAVQMIADRMDGKAVQEVNATIEDRTELSQKSEDELRELVARRIAGTVGGPDGTGTEANQARLPKPRGLH